VTEYAQSAGQGCTFVCEAEERNSKKCGKGSLMAVAGACLKIDKNAQYFTFV
jgi:hypothetical protein